MRYDDLELRRGYRDMAADVEREAEAIDLTGPVIEGWDPILDEPLRRALDDWTWLCSMHDKELIDATPFGDLILRGASAEMYWLDVNAGQVADFAGTEEEKTRIYDLKTARELERQGLTIERSQCYGLKPQAIFKANTLENTYAATMSQYVSFMGNFHRQIKGPAGRDDRSSGGEVMRDVVIAAAVRTAVGKAPRGALRTVRPDDLAAFAIVGALERVKALERTLIEDVILGCAMPEAEQGLNVARVASFRAGLPVSCSAMTVNRFCSSGLQSIAMAVDRVRGGGAEAVVAGGVESMSFVPMSGNKPSLNPWLVENWPGSYLSMGLTAERVAKHYGITREQMDEFAYGSHQKALAAIAAGRFADEIVPVPVTNTMIDAKGNAKRVETMFAVEEGPRADTSLEALAKLKPAFHAKGTVTAGYSSQTSDGAAAAVVMSAELAAQIGAPVMGRLIAFATAGCDPEEMGVGPVFAVPKALKMAGLTLDEIGLIELNEAFAAQALAVIKLLEIDPAKVNVNGGAIALGHPLGCTGAKLTASLLHEMPRRKAQYGMVTMCVGGGMGAAGIFEAV